MKKQINKFNIFEIEHFNGLLNDFEVIFNEKNSELKHILSANILESIKKEEINKFLFVVLKYDNTIKSIKARFVSFKKSPEYKDLSEKNQNLVKEFDQKMNSNILEWKKLIEKCETFLNSDEKRIDLM